MATVIKCPVCGNSVSGNVCDKCGWMRLVFPAEVPTSLKSICSEQENTLRRLIEEKDSLSLAVSKEKSLLAQEKDSHNITKDNLHKANSDLADASSKILELNKQLKEKPKVEQQPILGMVMVKNRDTEAEQCLPVFPGTNTYGTAQPSSTMHHQITLLDRKKVFLPIHFTVESTHKGLAIKSCGPMTYRGLPFTTKLTANSDFFIIGDESQNNTYEVSIKEF